MLSPSKPKRIKSSIIPPTHSSGGQLTQLIPSPVPKVAKFPGRDSALLGVRSQGVYLQILQL